MNKSTKYTKERLAPIIAESKSLAEVMKKLGIKWSGGQQQNIKRWIRIYELDISHFLGQRINLGSRSPLKKKWQDILIKMPDNNRRQVAFILRRALIESGREYKCIKCQNDGYWCGKELRLQINHKDGNWLNNTPENLEFICPNCHSQTTGWSGNKGKTGLTTTMPVCNRSYLCKDKFCIDCKANISKRATRCKSCQRKRPKVHVA